MTNPAPGPEIMKIVAEVCPPPVHTVPLPRLHSMVATLSRRWPVSYNVLMSAPNVPISPHAFHSARDFIIVIAATVDRHVVENTFALAISAVGTVHTAHDDRAVIVAACIPVHHRANDHKRDIGLACAVIVP